MMHRRKPTEAAVRAGERRVREDASARLGAQVPGLKTLELAISEKSRGGPAIGETRHVRRFVVESAPALFELPCSDKACTGSHDITRDLLAALRTGKERFEGEHPCGGTTTAGASCERVLQYTATATYEKK